MKKHISAANCAGLVFFVLCMYIAYVMITTKENVPAVKVKNNMNDNGVAQPANDRN